MVSTPTRARGDAARPLVGAARQQAGARLKRAERADVRARVEVLGDLQRQQRAVALGGHLDVEDLAAAVGRGLDALGARLDPARRAA